MVWATVRFTLELLEHGHLIIGARKAWITWTLYQAGLFCYAGSRGHRRDFRDLQRLSLIK